MGFLGGFFWVGYFGWVFFGWVFYCQPCLVQQQVVQRRNGVEEHRLHGRGEQLHQGRYSARFEDGEQALTMEFLDNILTKDSRGVFWLHAIHSSFYWRKTIVYSGLN